MAAFMVLSSMATKKGGYRMGQSILCFLPMDFPNRLSQLRKQRSLSQQALADATGIHANQIKRYEGGTSQPTLEALIKLAKALHTTLDALVFEADDRGPDDELRMQLEAISEFDADEKDVALNVLEGLILKHQAKRAMQRLQPKNKKAS